MQFTTTVVNKRHCEICGSDYRPLRISSQNHQHPHGNHERACNQCWEAWISLQLEENQPDEIKCMFCNSNMGFKEISSLARPTTVYRYKMKLKLKDGFICMARCTRLRQAFDREKDGRVFTCVHCGFEACYDCDHPEHKNESCDEYLHRHRTIHGDAEDLTRKAYMTCPDCTAAIETEKASCHTLCDCGYRFCSACMIPWVGQGSAYLHGKEAHRPGCKYRTRDAESKHSLSGRWQQTEDVQQRLSIKKESNRIKNEARKRTRAETSSGFASEPTGKAKKRKT
ncbi:hypothetical protein Q7P37_006794 [Cladosporium fusiforme]